MDIPIQKQHDDSDLNFHHVIGALHLLEQCLVFLTNKWVNAFHEELDRNVPQPYSKNGPTISPQQQASDVLRICKTCTNNDVIIRNGTWSVQCPSEVCSVWMKHIVKYHENNQYPDIACSNLKPQLWPVLPWEVAKCFLPSDCEGVTSARDADLAAILILLKKCKYMSKFFKDPNLLTEVLAVQNRLMRSTIMSVSDNQLLRDTNTMIGLLESIVPEGLLLTDCEEIRWTIVNIQKLQSNTMDMSLDLTVTAGNTMMRSLNREISSLRNRYRDFEKISQALNRISNKSMSLKEAYKNIQTHTNQTKADTPRTDIDKTWLELCKGLQSWLTGFYKKTCLMVKNPVQNDDIGYEYLYVDPVLRERKGGSVFKEVCGLHCSEIFYTDEHKCRYIFITGDHFIGKTMVTLDLVRLWCEAHGESFVNGTEECESDSDDEDSCIYPRNKHEERKQAREKRRAERKDRSNDNKQILSHFTFVFFINSKESLSKFSMAEMIQSQILDHYTTDKVLSASELLIHEKCLVILDCLDNQTCLQGSLAPYIVNACIPGISNDEAVFITTATRLELDTSNLQSSTMVKHLEVRGINEQSASQLFSKLIKLMNEDQIRCKRKHFFKTIKKEGLDHFLSMPFFLSMFLCIWLEKSEPILCQAHLYISIFQKAQKFISKQAMGVSKTVSSEKSPPQYFLNKPFCQKNHPLIHILSKVSFHALFDKTTNTSYLFERFQMETSVLVSQKEMSFSLNEPFQPFFAATYIASSDEPNYVFNRILNTCSTPDTILGMSRVWLFIAGQRPDITRQLWSHFSQVVTTSKLVQNHRQTFDDGVCSVQAIQNCVVNCVKEGRHNNYTYDKVCIEDVCISGSTIYSVGAESLFSCNQLSKIKSVCINTANIDSGHSTFILGQLQKCHSIQKLLLDDQRSCLPSNALIDVVAQKIATITCLSLCVDITATDELVSILCSKSECLLALRLKWVKLTHEHKAKIISTLSRSPTLIELELVLYCTDCNNQCRSRIDVASMKQIQRLTLEFVFVDNLQDVPDTVEKVDLWNVKIPITSLREIANSFLHRIPDLTVILSYVTFTETENCSVDKKTLNRESCGHMTDCEYNESSNDWSLVLCKGSQ